MIIREAINHDEIKSILFDPDIQAVTLKGIAYDYDKPLPKENCYYLGGYHDGKIFAVSCFHVFKDGLKFHPYVIKSHRLRYAKEFIQLSLTMLKCKIYIEIPKSRKKLYNLAVKLGFDSEANNSASEKHLMSFNGVCK